MNNKHIINELVEGLTEVIETLQEEMKKEVLKMIDAYHRLDFFIKDYQEQRIELETALKTNKGNLEQTKNSLKLVYFNLSLLNLIKTGELEIYDEEWNKENENN